MAFLAPKKSDLNSRLLHLKRRSLLLFFAGGALMSLVSFFLPTRDPPSPALEAWGLRLFALTLGLSLAALVWLWRGAGTVRGRRADALLMIVGNLCVTLSITAETLLFTSQISAMVTLWPVVVTVGFMGSGVRWAQVGFSAASLLVASLLSARFVTPGSLWPVAFFASALPLLFTGVAIRFFRDAATYEAQELSRALGTDFLTGLPNRRALFEGFADLVGRLGPGQGVAVAVLDLDHFKRVNDQHGHQGGDEVLQAFARTLRSHARSGDLPARLGGEEFVWVSVAAQGEAFFSQVEALRVAFAASPEARGVTVSAGLAYGKRGASAPLDPVDLSGLLNDADAALYQSKAAGRNRTSVFHRPDRPLSELDLAKR